MRLLDKVVNMNFRKNAKILVDSSKKMMLTMGTRQWDKHKDRDFSPLFLVVNLAFFALFFLIGVPAAVSSFGLVIDQEGLSPEGGIGLALLAAALVAIAYWLAPKLTGADTDTDTKSWSANWIGGSFLLSALSLTLFAMLAPLVEEIVKDSVQQSWWTTLVKYADGISMMIGVVSLSCGVFLGLRGFAILFVSAIETNRRRKKTRRHQN
jgi:hypothetical protein